MRVSADINLTPNAVKALDGLGIGEGIRRFAARPTHRISRIWDTAKKPPAWKCPTLPNANTACRS